MSDKDQLKAQVAERIRGLREARGLQQIELEAALHIGPNNVSNWETCVSLITTYRLKQFCDFFNCSADYLLGTNQLVLSPKEYQLLQNFRSGDERDQDLLLTMSETLMQRHQ